MRRGELYRVYKGSPRDPKRHRIFVIVSRQEVIDSRFSTVICAPVYSMEHGFVTQVSVGPEEGLKRHSSIYCDELISLPKAALTDHVGSLPVTKLDKLRTALRAALDVE